MFACVRVPFARSYFNQMQQQYDKGMHICDWDIEKSGGMEVRLNFLANMFGKR